MAIIKNGFLINTSKNVGGTIYYKYKGDQFSRSMPQYPEGWTGSEKQQLVQRTLGTISRYIAERQSFAAWVNMNVTRRGRRYRGTGRDRLIGWTIDSLSHDSSGQPLTWDAFASQMNDMLSTESNTGLAVVRALPPTFSDIYKVQIDSYIAVGKSGSLTTITANIPQRVLKSWIGQQRYFSSRSFHSDELILYVWGSTLQVGATSPIYAIETELVSLTGEPIFSWAGEFPGDFTVLPYRVALGAKLYNTVNPEPLFNTVLIGGFSVR